MAATRVLIVRTSALGDIVHALPVLTALRRALPEARLGWVVEEVFAPLLDGHPDLDTILPVRLRVWRRRPFSAATARGVAGFLAAAQAFGAEVALDLMGNHKGGILGAVSLADRRLGLDRRFRREPSSAVWINQSVRPRSPHAVDRALAVLDALELPPRAADFGGGKLFRDAPERVDGQPLVGRPPFVALLPGAGWANKRYPPQRWGEVALLLGERLGIDSWVVSGPGEEGIARETGLASKGWARIVHAAGLTELAAVLRHARLVLGGDTGPIHLAHALGTPVLCLMGPTDPLRSGPYGAPERTIWTPLPCSFCEKRLEGPKACLLAVSPRRVAERAAELLGGAGGA